MLLNGVATSIVCFEDPAIALYVVSMSHDVVCTLNKRRVNVFVYYLFERSQTFYHVEAIPKHVHLYVFRNKTFHYLH